MVIIMQKLNRQVFGTLALVALVSSGCGGPSKEEHAPAPRTGTAELETVMDAEIPNVYEATGTIHPHLRSTLSSKILAKVLSVNVRPGDRVRAGQILVQLDSRDLSSAVRMAGASLSASQAGVESARTSIELERKSSAARIAQATAQVAQAQAALASANAQLSLAQEGPRQQDKDQAHLAVVQAESTMKLAQTELDRMIMLVEAGAVAQRQLDIARNNFDVAKAAYETAVSREKTAIEGSRRQELKAAQEAVSQAKAAVRLAQAGLQQANAAALQVEMRRNSEAQAMAQVSESAAMKQSADVALSYATIAAPYDGIVTQRTADPGTMAAPGTPLITLESMTHRLEVEIPEGLMQAVSVGSEANVRFDAVPGKVFTGRLTEIVPQSGVASHTFVAKYELPSDPRLKSGIYGRADVPNGRRKGLSIPQGASWTRDGLSYVYVVNAESVARLRIVTLGKQGGGRIVVLSGLAPGERVVKSDPGRITDGMTIQVTSR